MSKKRSNVKGKASRKKSPRITRKQSGIWKWIGIGLVLVILVVSSIILLSNNTSATEISAIQSYKKFQQGAFFLDVRSQEEWNQSHIANSISIPLNELQNRLDELPNNRDIVVVCLIGKRSREGMTILRDAGYSRATCMTGGLNAWKAAGYPLEGNNP